MPEGDGEVYQLITLPPHSPDLHKVVEHAIGYAKRTFKKEFTQLLGKVGHHRAMELMEEVLKEAITQDGIQRDAESMVHTINSIIKNRGDWADKPFR